MGRLRSAQEAGLLDPAWDPLDILAFVNQIAVSGVVQPHLPADPDERERYLAARRSAAVAAVRRLFPAADDAPENPLAGS